MRVSSLYLYNTMMSQMSINSDQMSKLHEQLATQKRVNVPSDDPVTASSRRLSSIKAISPA